MTEHIQNPREFAVYAGGELTKWKEAIHKNVRHKLFGQGIVIAVQEEYIHISFKKGIKKFYHDDFLNENYFIDFCIANIPEQNTEQSMNTKIHSSRDDSKGSRWIPAQDLLDKGNEDIDENSRLGYSKSNMPEEGKRYKRHWPDKKGPGPYQ